MLTLIVAVSGLVTSKALNSCGIIDPSNGNNHVQIVQRDFLVMALILGLLAGHTRNPNKLPKILNSRSLASQDWMLVNSYCYNTKLVNYDHSAYLLF